MTLALDQPSLIADIVSVDNAPVDATLSRSFAAYVRGMRKIDEAGVSRQVEADAILADYEPDLGIRQFLLGNLQRTTTVVPDSSSEEGKEQKKKNVVKFRIPLDTLGKSLDHMGDFPFKDPNQNRFEKPALFVRGTKSKYVPDEFIPLIGQFFPRFSLVDIDAGHWVISEKPAEFLKGACCVARKTSISLFLFFFSSMYLFSQLVYHGKGRAPVAGNADDLFSFQPSLNSSLRKSNRRQDKTRQEKIRQNKTKQDRRYKTAYRAPVEKILVRMYHISH